MWTSARTFGPAEGAIAGGERAVATASLQHVTKITCHAIVAGQMRKLDGAESNEGSLLEEHWKRTAPPRVLKTKANPPMRLKFDDLHVFITTRTN